MLLVVGLGNPGSSHARNRHNIGFMTLDAVCRVHRFARPRKRFQGEAAEGAIDGEKIIALKPSTFMNESGRSVGAALRYHRLKTEDVVVLYDEIDLAPGKVRVKRGGGNAGHNGLKSIDDHIGSEYRRVRLGIGHPGNRDRVSGHVLKDFSKADRVWLEKFLDAVADAMPLLIAGDDPGFMTRVALLTQPPREKKAAPSRREDSDPSKSGPAEPASSEDEV